MSIFKRILYVICLCSNLFCINLAVAKVISLFHIANPAFAAFIYCVGVVLGVISFLLVMIYSSDFEKSFEKQSELKKLNRDTNGYIKS